MDLNQAIRVFRFFDTYREMPKGNILFNEAEYTEAQKIILYYMKQIELDQLHKICKHCQRVKPVSEFGFTTEDKLRAACRLCYAKYQADYTVNNADAIKSQSIIRELRIVENIKKKKQQQKLK